MFEELLTSHAERTPSRVALRIKRAGAYRQWTYSELLRGARSAAGCLRRAGVAPGDRVALLADSSPEWVLAYFGIYLAGAVVVPLDAQYAARELATVLGFARCRGLIAPRDKLELLPAEARRSVEMVLLLDDPALFISPPADPLVRRPDELMAILFTSGTTGEPKGVCLTVGNLASNVGAILELRLATGEDNTLSVLPLHHSYGMTTSVLALLAAGGEVTMCASLRGPDIFEAMRETGVTTMPGVPRLFEALDRTIQERVRQSSWSRRIVFRLLTGISGRVRRLAGLNLGRLLFPSVHRMFGPRLRCFVSGGAKLDADVCQRLLDLGLVIAEGYGLTETSPVVTMNSIRRPRPGSAGRPIPGVEVRIAEPDAHGVGEVLVRGPNVMAGYDRRPEETAAALRGGWFHTGDLGRLDGKGFLYLTGRAKEVIVMASGQNIYPEDVERLYEQSPIIREICVMPVALPDGRVSRLQAIVVPDLDELQRRKVSGLYDTVKQEVLKLAQGLPSYMRVTELKLVRDPLPRTRLGKLRRGLIRTMTFDELAAVSSAPSGEDHALLAAPGAEQLIGRIRSLSAFEAPILPGHHLELDLGLDSLARVELNVSLEHEFGLKIPPAELAQVNTVGDLLRRLSGGPAEGAVQEGWGAILRRPGKAPRLAELFPAHGLLKRRALALLRCAMLRLAQRAFPLDLRGFEHLPKGRAFLLCPTHASLMDAVLLYFSLPEEQAERMYYLGAEDFFRSRAMRWVARTARIIVTRTSDTVQASLERAAEALSTGRSVCIFPEGFITRDGFLHRPHPGAGILACELGVPIVPALMRGTFDIYSYAHPGLRRRPIGITMARPIFPPAKERYGNTDYAALMLAWHRAVIELRREDDARGGPTAGRSPRLPDPSSDEADC